MKRGVLVVRLLDANLAEAGRAEIELEGDLAANVNSRCQFHVECFIETREYIAQTEAPFWDMRSR